MKKVLLLIVVIAIGLYSCKENKSIYNETALLKKIREKTGTNNTYYYFNVWNTSCIPCIQEMPDIDSLAALYKSKVDFIFITNEADEKIEQFFKAKSIKIDYSIFMNNEENTISFLSEKIGKNRLSYPTHIIMNDKFDVIHHHTGGLNFNVKGVNLFDPILTKALKNLK